MEKEIKTGIVWTWTWTWTWMCMAQWYSLRYYRPYTTPTCFRFVLVYFRVESENVLNLVLIANINTPSGMMSLTLNTPHRAALFTRVRDPIAIRSGAVGHVGLARSRRPVSTRVMEVNKDVVTATAPSTLEPALLEGTPTNFSIPPEQLIQRAKAVFETDTGVKDDSVLADNFRFEFPVVSLDREGYLKAVRGFSLEAAFPDLDAHPYDWRVDRYEPNRVWFTIRTTGTHLGTLKFGSSSYPATNKRVMGAPECCSYTFDEQGKVLSFTGGVVMDRRVGNTQGLGALFGILAAIGVKIPRPGTLAFAVAVTINRIMTWVRGLFGKKDA